MVFCFTSRIVRSRQPLAGQNGPRHGPAVRRALPPRTQEEHMLRRWRVPLAGLGLVLGSIAAAGTASAAPAPPHAQAAHIIGPAAHLVGPASHGTRPLIAHGGPVNAAESTNWSGYAANGGTYTKVSASWVEPTGTCSGRTAQYYSWYEMY